MLFVDHQNSKPKDSIFNEEEIERISNELNNKKQNKASIIESKTNEYKECDIYYVDCSSLSRSRSMEKLTSNHHGTINSESSTTRIIKNKLYRNHSWPIWREQENIEMMNIIQPIPSKIDKIDDESQDIKLKHSPWQETVDWNCVNITL